MSVDQTESAGSVGNDMSLDSKGELIEEALVRRIRDANRFSGVIEAWEALQKVQHERKVLVMEKEILGLHK